MNPRFAPAVLCAATLLLVSRPILAQAHAAQPGPVHGTTIVDLTLKGRDLTIEFELSGKDAVGFEHVPRTAAEQAKVVAARAILENPDDWLAPNAEARCRRWFSSVAPNIYRVDEQPAAPAAKPRRDDAAHARFGVQYSFTCDAAARLRAIRFDLIARFAELRGIIVNLKLPNGNAQELLITPQGEITLAAPAQD